MNQYKRASGGFLSRGEISTLKQAARYMRLDWRMLAARPVWSDAVLGCIRRAGGDIAAGCEEFRGMDL